MVIHHQLEAHHLLARHIMHIHQVVNNLHLLYNRAKFVARLHQQLVIIKVNIILCKFIKLGYQKFEIGLCVHEIFLDCFTILHFRIFFKRNFEIIIMRSNSISGSIERHNHSFIYLFFTKSMFYILFCVISAFWFPDFNSATLDVEFSVNSL